MQRNPVEASLDAGKLRRVTASQQPPLSRVRLSERRESELAQQLLSLADTDGSRTANRPWWKSFHSVDFIWRFRTLWSSNDAGTPQKPSLSLIASFGYSPSSRSVGDGSEWQVGLIASVNSIPCRPPFRTRSSGLYERAAWLAAVPKLPSCFDWMPPRPGMSYPNWACPGTIPLPFGDRHKNCRKRAKEHRKAHRCRCRSALGFRTVIGIDFSHGTRR